MTGERFFLIYQEASDDECLLTVEPYRDQQELAEAINQLQAKQVDEYTIIKGKKMKATLKLAVDLTEADENSKE
ncbi:hypothetical protein P4V43_03885 [Brevibacillus fortis]|uniref:hypothetical protein n=1 Tax=Brevibacillus fortis TaxID=2126352 RepID=UPI002E22D0E3|nr:hypothetical protein [Brevibacillus fortis]